MRLQKPQYGRKHYAGIRKDLSKALLGRRIVLDKQEKYLNIVDRKGNEVQEKVKSSFQKFMLDTKKSVKL